MIKKSGAIFQCWENNNFYYRDFLDFSKDPKLNEKYENLGPWARADFTQKFFPNSGKLSFVLRKNPKFLNLWYKKDQIKSNYFVYSNPSYSGLEMINIKNNYGGLLEITISFKLKIKESIIYDNLNREIIKF